MTTILVTAPSVEPVTLSEARAWLRIDADVTDQDTLISLMIQSMREYAENLTGRAFVPRALAQIRPCFESCMELQAPPLLSVQSVTYYDINNALQTLSASLYDVQEWHEPGRVIQPINAVWPATYYRDDAVRIDYTAGYLPPGSPTDYTDTGNIPAALKLWMHARLATLFENREQLVLNNLIEIPRGFADALLDALVVGSRIA